MPCPICGNDAPNCDCTPEERRMHEKAKELLDRVAALEAAVPRWIPVSERLPPLLQEVLGWHKNDRVRSWFRHSGTASCGRHWESWTPQDRECDDCSVREPTHWMPLPLPPAKEDD